MTELNRLYKSNIRSLAPRVERNIAFSSCGCCRKSIQIMRNEKKTEISPPPSTRTLPVPPPGSLWGVHLPHPPLLPPCHGLPCSSSSTATTTAARRHVITMRSLQCAAHATQERVRCRKCPRLGRVFYAVLLAHMQTSAAQLHDRPEQQGTIG